MGECLGGEEALLNEKREINWSGEWESHENNLLHVDQCEYEGSKVKGSRRK